jgi:cytochrome o ubiquinol oxidase subunit 2
MSKHRKSLVWVLPITALIVLAAALTWGTNVAVLNPKGSIAREQFDLIVFTSLLSLVVVIPVFLLTFYIAWKYRATNTKARYQPEWDRSKLLEAVWWLIPLALITVLAVVTWVSTHKLDPYRPLESDKKPVMVQVIALQWKWLFIYPEENIATVNHIEFPVDRPVNFYITSDAPMNSFWIPQLGGQIYAMSGMQTKLHLMADTPGVYNGSSANISGSGFADMKFTATATSEAKYQQWLEKVRQSPRQLDTHTYDQLAGPSKRDPVRYYASRDEDLYDTVITKYMMHDMGTRKEQDADGYDAHEGHH